MNEELKTILEAAYIIKERLTLESPFVCVDITACGDDPINIHFHEKPDFITEYVKSSYDEKSDYCYAMHDGVKMTWFEEVNKNGSIEEDTGRA